MSLLTASPQTLAFRKPFRFLALTLVVAWSFFPLYWGLATSLMSTNTADALPIRYFPDPLYLNNYPEVLGLKASGLGTLPSQFQQALINSVIESVGSVVVTVVVAILAAYAFARLTFRFKRTILVTTIATLMFPIYATLLPLYKLMADFRLVNTYPGIILVNASSFIPLAIWILYNYFAGLPQELEEAAFVDGAMPLQALARIMIPLSVPGIAATAAIVFLLSWGQFMLPLVLTTNLASEPVTVVIAALYGPHLVSFTLMAAAGILAIAIPAVLALLLNRYVVSGLTAGSTK